MNQESTHQLESELRSLQAAALDAGLLNRLEAASDGSLKELSALEREFESSLLNTHPKPLSDEFLDALEQAAAKIPFPADDGVIPFPASHAEARRSWWRHAAAVALLGGLSALLWVPRASNPADPSSLTETRPSQLAAPSAANIDPASLIPAEFSRNLSKTSDEGVIWPSNAGPHRLIKVTYMEKVTLEHEDGSTYQVERPRVEYYIVPTKSD